MKFIIVLSFVAFVAIQFQYSAGEEFKCIPEVPYKENECNGCFCSPTHLLACTQMFCSDVDSTKLHNCAIGTTWTKGCNQCWCVEKQGTICTDKKCEGLH